MNTWTNKALIWLNNTKISKSFDIIFEHFFKHTHFEWWHILFEIKCCVSAVVHTCMHLCLNVYVRLCTCVSLFVWFYYFRLFDDDDDDVIAKKNFFLRNVQCHYWWYCEHKFRALNDWRSYALIFLFYIIEVSVFPWHWLIQTKSAQQQQMALFNTKKYLN